MLRAQSRETAPQDPLDLLAAARAPRALWWDGRTGILHEGLAASIEAEGTHGARDILDELPSFDHEGPSPGPLWLGGLAFAGDHRAQGAWTAFPAARFTVGRRQVALQDGAWTETFVEADAADGAPPPEADGLAAMDRQAWDAAVETAVRSIQEGDVAKVVLARARKRPPGDPVATLRRMREREPDGAMFYFEPVAGHAFLGTTPECLVRLEDGAVRTHALAGSAPRGGSPDDDARLAKALLGSQKDVLEHELVTAFLRERLAEAGVTDIRQERRRVRALGAVQHLETPISGRSEGRHVLQLAAALHPTPAVCGTPRRRSLDLIRRLEPSDRGWYAGAVGWFDATGQGEVSVALRCALSLPHARYLFAGAGIVAGSEPGDEWDETAAKMQSLEEALWAT